MQIGPLIAHALAVLACLWARTDAPAQPFCPTFEHFWWASGRPERDFCVTAFLHLNMHMQRSEKMLLFGTDLGGSGAAGDSDSDSDSSDEEDLAV